MCMLLYLISCSVLYFAACIKQCIVLYCILFYCVVLYSFLLYCIVLCFIALYCVAFALLNTLKSLISGELSEMKEKDLNIWLACI